MRWTPLPHQSDSAWPALTSSLPPLPLPSTMSKPVARRSSCGLETANFVCHLTLRQCPNVAPATPAHTRCALHFAASAAHFPLAVVSSTGCHDCTVSCQALVLNFSPVPMRHNCFAMQPIPLNFYLMKSPAKALSGSIPLCKICVRSKHLQQFWCVSARVQHAASAAAIPNAPFAPLGLS